MKNTHAKTYIIVVILISIVGISIAYAALSQQLQIKTNTTVQSSQTSWNIVLEADGCSSGGTITVNGMTVTVSGLTLKKPGDDLRCYFYIHNKGELDAKISSVDYQTPIYGGSDNDVALVSGFIGLGVRWPRDNWPYLVKGDTVLSTERKRVEVQLYLRSEMTSLPINPVTYSRTWIINFEQA